MAACTDDSVSQKLYAYELDMLEEPDRTAVEVHILECPACHERAMRFQHAAALLRQDTDVRQIVRELAGAGEQSAAPIEPSVPLGWVGRKRVYIPAFAAAAALFLFLLFTDWQLGFKLHQEAVARAPRIAVLPFENLGDPDDAYFVDGVTDEIRIRLAKLSGLGVISRTSSDRYKNSDMDVRAIARELDADFILEGSVRWDRSGDTDLVRIAPLLIRAADNTHIWADAYDQAFTRIFTLQADIAGKVAQELDIAILAPERARMLSVPTSNMEAYRYYLKAQEVLNAGELTALPRIGMVEQLLSNAIGLDSSFAEAFAALSYLMSCIQFWENARGWTDRGYEDAAARALEYAQKAVSLDADAVKSCWAMGFYYYYCAYDYAKALEWFNRGLEHEPGNSELLNAAGELHFRFSAYDEAYDRLKQAAYLDPLNAIYADDFVQICLFQRRCDEVAAFLERAVTLNPDAKDIYVGQMFVAKYCFGSPSLLRATEDAARANGVRLYPNVAASSRASDPITRDFQAQLEATFELESWRAGPWNHVAFYLVEVAERYRFLGDSVRMHAYADSACAIYEDHLEDMLPSGKLRSLHTKSPLLPLAYALSGQHDKGLELLRQMLAEKPMERDGKNGVWLYLMALNRIAIVLGEYDLAIDMIEELLARPSPLTTTFMKVSPYYDPLRDHPRFRRLMEDYPA